MTSFAPATRWRSDGDGLDFSADARLNDGPNTALLTWLAATRPDPCESLDEVAERLVVAWRDLLGAFESSTELSMSVEAVALWQRNPERNPDPDRNGDKLRLLAIEPPAPELLGSAPDSASVVPLADPALWPDEPTWTLGSTDAQHDLISHLGLLSEQVALPSLVVPCGEVALLLLWLRARDGEVSPSWQPVLSELGAQSGSILANISRNERLTGAIHQLCEMMAAAVDAREPGREGLSGAVAFYCALIAREMELDETQTEQIEFAGLWHGIGRLNVPDALLRSNEPFEPGQVQQVRSAAADGALLLERIAGLQSVAQIVRHQHERFDGTGTPDALSGAEIPLGSRVLSVALHFAGMTHPRPDRAPLSVVSGAMDAVRAEAGTALDPGVVSAFLRAMGRETTAEVEGEANMMNLKLEEENCDG